MKIFSRFFQFFQREIWEIQLSDFPFLKAIFLKFLRMLLLAGFGFWKDQCQKNASMLTYYSLLNIVPVIAVAFGIAKGFGLEKLVEKQILQIATKANWQTTVTEQILAFSRSTLEHVRGGLIAGLGVILLFWTMISILGKIENSLNTIWGIKKTRPLVRKFSDYITLIVFAPILFVISSSATVFVTGHLRAMTNKIGLFGVFSSVFPFLLNVLPYVSIWVLLTLIYIVLPNTKVPIRSGIMGAFAAGTAFQILQWIYIKFQIGITMYGAIYGSLAALPLFLVWLQMSWMIILFGAEIAYANEHIETFGFHPDYSRISHSSKRLLIVRIFHLLVERFAKGEKPLDLKQIASKIQIPVRLLHQLLNELIEAGLIVEVSKGFKEETAFQPARTIEGMTLKAIIEAYEQKGDNFLPTSESPETQRILKYFKQIEEVIEKSVGNVQIKEI